MIYRYLSFSSHRSIGDSHEKVCRIADCISAQQSYFSLPRVKLWVDEQELNIGDPLGKKIVKNIEDCQVFLVFLDVHYKNRYNEPSPNAVQLELDTAIKERKVILTIFLEPYDSFTWDGKFSEHRDILTHRLCADFSDESMFEDEGLDNMKSECLEVIKSIKEHGEITMKFPRMIFILVVRSVVFLLAAFVIFSSNSGADDVIHQKFVSLMKLESPVQAEFVRNVNMIASYRYIKTEVTKVTDKGRLLSIYVNKIPLSKPDKEKFSDIRDSLVQLDVFMDKLDEPIHAFYSFLPYHATSMISAVKGVEGYFATGESDKILIQIGNMFSHINSYNDRLVAMRDAINQVLLAQEQVENSVAIGKEIFAANSLRISQNSEFNWEVRIVAIQFLCIPAFCVGINLQKRTEPPRYDGRFPEDNKNSM
jgi:hypothetical protein